MARNTITRSSARSVEDRKPSQFWLNIGLRQSDGRVKYLDVGIPLDNQRGPVAQALVDYMTTNLEPGERVTIEVVGTLYRVPEEGKKTSTIEIRVTNS